MNAVHDHCQLGLCTIKLESCVMVYKQHNTFHFLKEAIPNEASAQNHGWQHILAVHMTLEEAVAWTTALTRHRPIVHVPWCSGYVRKEDIVGRQSMSAYTKRLPTF